MLRVLVRSGKGPFTMVGPEATLTQDVFNSNVGNYLFAHSVFRALMVPGADLVSNATLSETRAATAKAAGRVNEEFDAFVIPLANAFRPDFAARLDNLASLVEQLKIPVVVIGVGAQAPLDLDTDPLTEIAPVVKRFTRAVLDRSATIGVRGEFTARYLHGLGFPESATEVIGCPSLFLHGPGFRLDAPASPLPDHARIALSLTEGVPGLGELVLELARRYENLVYLGQDKEDLRLALWGEEPDRPTDPGIPLRRDHPLFLMDRVRFPLETWSWLRHLSGYDYAVGTRLHGNVAALLAGIPATLLAHDSRTWELAKYHELPHASAEAIHSGLSLESLHADYDPQPFNAAYPDRFARFVQFLDDNKLPHVYGEGGDQGAAFEGLAAGLDLPEVLAPLTERHPEQIAARLRWLRDGMAFDSTLHPQAYRQPFPYPPPRDQRTRVKRDLRDLQEVNKELGKEVRRAQSSAEAANKRADRQTQRLNRQAKRLEEIERRLADRWWRRWTRRLRSNS